MDELPRRRRVRSTPAINIVPEENERKMLDRQCERHNVDMTTYLRTVIVLIEKGTIKIPASAFANRG